MRLGRAGVVGADGGRAVGIAAGTPVALLHPTSGGCRRALDRGQYRSNMSARGNPATEAAVENLCPEPVDA
jgi:hypothetical protein